MFEWTTNTQYDLPVSYNPREYQLHKLSIDNNYVVIKNWHN